MGMSRLQVLVRVELPLAVPVILAGIRTALVINVGTATLATFVDGGGLGDIINSGIRLGRDARARHGRDADRGAGAARRLTAGAPRPCCGRRGL